MNTLATDTPCAGSHSLADEVYEVRLPSSLASVQLWDTNSDLSEVQPGASRYTDCAIQVLKNATSNWILMTSTDEV